MKKNNKFTIIIVIIITFGLLGIAFLGMFKFNVLANIKGYDVDGNLISLEDTTVQIKEKLIGSWLDTSERKLHFTLFKNGTAHSDNMKTLLYKKWKVDENRLIITAKSIGNKNSSVNDNIYEIILLNDNELVLKNGKLIERYVRK